MYGKYKKRIIHLNAFLLIFINFYRSLYLLTTVNKKIDIKKMTFNKTFCYIPLFKIKLIIGFFSR